MAKKKKEELAVSTKTKKVECPECGETFGIKFSGCQPLEYCPFCGESSLGEDYNSDEDEIEEIIPDEYGLYSFSEDDEDTGKEEE